MDLHFMVKDIGVVMQFINKKEKEWKKSGERKRDGPDAAGFRLRVGDEGKVFEIPKEDASISSAGGQQKFVRVEDHLRDRGRVLPQFRQQPSSPQIPHLQIARFFFVCFGFQNSPN